MKDLSDLCLLFSRERQFLGHYFECGETCGTAPARVVLSFIQHVPVDQNTTNNTRNKDDDQG
jgi:hypothetical protein